LEVATGLFNTSSRQYLPPGFWRAQAHHKDQEVSVLLLLPLLFKRWKRQEEERGVAL
jgi:hypothetical protein